MLNLTLGSQIYTFVSKLMVVEERQIYRFFRDTEGGRASIAYEIDKLSRTGRIFPIKRDEPQKFPEGSEEAKLRRLWCVARTVPTRTQNYMDIMRAVDVMIELPSKQVNWFEIDDYPHELVFQTEDDVTYDVTVFHSRSWVSKYAQENRTRSKNLPDNESDATNHVAVVDDQSLIPKIEPLGFAMFIMVDRNGTIIEKWTY